MTQTQELPRPFDTPGLIDYLRTLGLEEEMLHELQDALDADAEEEQKNGHDEQPTKLGRNVLTWLKNISTGVITQVGTPVSVALINAALLHYFHF